MNETKLTEAILTTLTTVLYEYVINGDFMWVGAALFYEPELDTVFYGSAAENDLMAASNQAYVLIDRNEWHNFLPRNVEVVPEAARKLTELIMPLMEATIKPKCAICNRIISARVGGVHRLPLFDRDSGEKTGKELQIKVVDLMGLGNNNSTNNNICFNCLDRVMTEITEE